MGPDATPEAGAYVGQLADHARRLHGEARDAIARGDYAKAAALIDNAELLAEDVHGLVGDIEDRETQGLLTLAAAHVAASEQARRSIPRVPLPSRRVRLALGTSLMMSLALTEC